MAVVTLNKKETTTEEPKVVTTQKEPSVTTTITATESPFRKADGGVDNEAVNAFNQSYRDPLARAYDIDPISGRFVGDVGTLLGFDPEKYKTEQAAKARLAQFKQKEAGWRNGLGVIMDAVTAGIGGNVWERKPDTKAAEARTENEQANTLINSIGKAVNDAKKGQELAYNKARQEALNKYISDFGRKISQKTTQGNRTVQVTQGNGKTTTGFRQEQEHQGNSDGSGNGGKKQESQDESGSTRPHNRQTYTLYHYHCSRTGSESIPQSGTKRVATKILGRKVCRYRRTERRKVFG